MLDELKTQFQRMMDNQSEEMKLLVKQTVSKALADQTTKTEENRANNVTEKFYQ